MSDKKRMIIYTTLGCHLCDEALDMLRPFQEKGFVELTELDIADDDALLETYGERIPVLRRRGDGAELGWPFSIEEVERFLHGSH